MTRARQCTKFRRFLLKQTYYISVIFGLISTNFNFETRTFDHNKYQELYVKFMNAATIVVSPLVIVKTEDDGVYAGDNLQMKSVATVNIFIRFVVVILSLLFRCRRERGVRGIVECFLQLEQEYFDCIQYPQQILAKFDHMFLLKYLAIVDQSLSAIYVVYRFMRHTSFWWYVTFFYVVTVVNILHGVMIQYYLCLLYIGSRFHVLNYRLREIFEQIRNLKQQQSRRSQYHMEKALAAEMDHITYVHCNLQKILHQLNDLYKFQIIFVLVSQIFNNVTMGYYCVAMSLDSTKFQMDTFDLALGAANYAMLLLDMYLMDVACDIIQVAHKETGVMMKKFFEFDELQESLEKSCEMMSLHLMHQKLYIVIAGMFKWNKQTSFVMFGFTIRQVIILVQNDIATA